MPDIRRGILCSHKVFGEKTAVLAGYSLVTLAFEHVASKTIGVSPDRIVRAIAELSSASGPEGLVGGQVVDLCSEGKTVDINVLDYIHINKTGKLLEASIVCGAILGGGNVEEVERLRKYGRCIGLLYQVMDDIFNLTKSPEWYGKTTGSDLLSDKATYPKLMGLDGSQKFATELISRAMEELDYFDAAKAAPLYHLANYIVYR